MNKYIIDSYAWMEYLEGTPKGERVKKMVENKENEIYTLAITLAEIVSKFKRRNMDYEPSLKSILLLSKVFDIDSKTSVDAGLVHAQAKQKIKDFGIADAFVLALARNLKARVLTGDPHFKGFREALMI